MHDLKPDVEGVVRIEATYTVGADVGLEGARTRQQEKLSDWPGLNLSGVDGERVCIHNTDT